MTRASGPAEVGGRGAAAPAWLRAVLTAQRGALFPWVPVCLGAGIGLYFAAPREPPVAGLVGTALAGTVLLIAGYLWRHRGGPLAVAPALVLLGLALAGARAHGLAAPVLGFRYYGPVDGRVIHIDRSASDALRLTLDRVVLERMSPARTPARVRVSLHGPGVHPEPGMTVILTAHLSPPPGPVEPGGYDFRRQAWFDRLGAVGYTRTPVLMLEPPRPGAVLWFARLRARLSAAIRAVLPGPSGAFAATIMTGDRSGLTRATADDLRAANLSHLLSISGLHMVLVCGTVFAAVRTGLALVPPLALRLPIRKIAAIAALVAGLFYDLLSGRGVPAERAWIMVAVMFGAVLVDRRAISLRAVAAAALVILTVRPESLVEPGFQMSFAATVALVAAFDTARRRGLLAAWRGRRLVGPVLTLLLSSAVAGGATAPVAAAHFGRIADYGLIANLASVPLMGLAIMPLAVIWCLAAPLGLGGPVLLAMGWPIAWILAVAHHVAALPGAVSHVVAPGPWVLPLYASGGLILALWQGRMRLAGGVPILVGLALWSQTARPDLLISDDGRLLGLMTSKGRALSKPSGQSFAAASWLEDDGDGASQVQAAQRTGFLGEDGEVGVQVGPLRIVQVSGRGAAPRAAAACAKADVVLSTVPLDTLSSRPCALWDPILLRDAGTVAISARDGAVILDTAARRNGGRLWAPEAGEDLPRPATLKLAQ